MVAKVSDLKVVHICNVTVCLVVGKQVSGEEKMISTISALSISLAVNSNSSALDNWITTFAYNLESICVYLCTFFPFKIRQGWSV